MSEEEKAEGQTNREKVLAFIAGLSVGQHRLKLYFKKQDQYSSPLGGIVTLIFVLILMVITFKILVDTIKRTNVFLDQDAVPIKDSPEVLNMRVGEFFETSLMQPNVLVYTKNLRPDCSLLNVSIVYNATEVMAVYPMKEHKSDFDSELTCIFLGNLSDPSFMTAITAYKDRVAIEKTRLGYVFNVGIFVENLLPGMVTVNWLEIDAISQSGKASEQRITQISAKQGFNIINVDLGFYSHTNGIVGLQQKFMGIGDTYQTEIVIGGNI